MTPGIDPKSRCAHTRPPALPATSSTVCSSRSAISSKSTFWSNDWLRVSCTRAMEPTRRTASSSAARASGSQPPTLQPQQRGDRLQVVLHPVVDLPDRRLLRDQLALAQP